MRASRRLFTLTSAVRNNAAETIQANYAYTYDASDNMLTKSEPFEDKFNDTNYTGWTPLNSSYWQVVDGALKTVVQSWQHVMEKQFADADYELAFDYMSLDTSSAGYYAAATLRQTSTGGRVAVYFYPDRAELHDHELPEHVADDVRHRDLKLFHDDVPHVVWVHPVEPLYGDEGVVSELAAVE